MTQSLGSWWLVLCLWGLSCWGESGECQLWGSVGLGVGFIFPAVIVARALGHFGAIPFSVFLNIFHMTLPWGHIGFIVSVRVTCVWSLVLPLSSSACQLVYFVPYASCTNWGMMTGNLFSPLGPLVPASNPCLSNWQHLLSSTSQRVLCKMGKGVRWAADRRNRQKVLTLHNPVPNDGG